MQYELQALLFSALLHSCGSRTASTFTPSQPVCPGERVQFNCTVVDDGQPIHGYTFWNISTVRRICVLAHFLRSDQDRCGLFTAQLYFEGVGSSCFFSSFTAIARTELNNSVVQCLGPSETNLVGSDTLKIIGPASFPILKLSANWIMETENPDDYNVTVQWNLQGSINDDYGSVSRYVITVAPEVLPCGGSGRCVVTPAMDEFALREFTFTMRVGQTYSVTIQSDNCNNTQSGIPSSPYNITLQRPAVTTNCTSYAVYNYSSNILISIDTQWSIVPPASDIAPGLNASVSEYEIMLQSDSGHSVTERVQSSSSCIENICAHNFISWSANGSSYHVSIAARNAVTLGRRRTCNSKSLRTTNNLLQVEIHELGNSVVVQCRLLNAFTERAHCEAWYGTDPSHHALPYHDVSDSAGTGGDVLTIHLSHNFQHNTSYYTNISLTTVNGNLCNKVIHSFRIDCDPTVLGSLVSTSDATCRREESSLQIEHGSVCYTGRMRGALAYYTCDNGHQLAVASHGSSVTQVRVCQENGRWNGTAPVCVPLEGGTTAAAALRSSEAIIGSVVAAAAFVIGVLSTAAVYCCIVTVRQRQRQRSKQCYSDPLHPAPPLPPRLQHQKANWEVDYEEVSVVVADGGSGSIEMKTNVAYGPVRLVTSTDYSSKS